MPSLAPFHPQIVHFVVALLIVGVVFRIVALTGLLKFTNHAAATLLLAGTVAAWLAVKSGTAAHGPVERIPGTREQVIEHEERGETTLNIFYAVAVIELVALALARNERRARFARFAHMASVAVGLVGVFQLYETAEHGGALVYSYAGGPGLRTGDPKDGERVLLAGLYIQSRQDRKDGRNAEAASLVNEMVKRFPADTSIRFLHVESLQLDSKDYRGALAALDSIGTAPTDARLGARKATVKADLYVALGFPDSARTVLTSAVAAFPQNTRLKAKLDSIH